MSTFDFDAIFVSTAESHSALLGGETVTLSRPHSLVDDRGQAVTSLRLTANAAIGATSITVEPIDGRIKGKLPAGMVLVAGVVVSAGLEVKDKPVTAVVVQVVALAAAFTAGAVWSLPAGASWTIANVLPFEDRVKLATFGQGAAGGDVDRGHQSPKIGFPVTSLAAAGVEPRAGDVVQWSLGRSKIVGIPKRMGDFVDAELELPS
jgi:hypothetical protein